MNKVPSLKTLSAAEIIKNVPHFHWQLLKIPQELIAFLFDCASSGWGKPILYFSNSCLFSRRLIDEIPNIVALNCLQAICIDPVGDANARISQIKCHLNQHKIIMMPALIVNNVVYQGKPVWDKMRQLIKSCRAV